jgi:Kdo2-lipid IVA lauroyltransferase/acyltransferase
MTSFFLWLVRLTAVLPLPWVRLLGSGLGTLLYLLVASRRHVVMTNLQLCFPDWTAARRRRETRAVFRYFGQAWLDRGWLWHGDPEQVRARLHLTGALEALQGDAPTVIFAPHFVGLDAGWTALTQQWPRRFTTIYTDQANRQADAWILQGRQRFGQSHLYGRSDGVKAIVSGLKAGDPLYLLPDMNFGPEDSVFVPFFGVPAATVPSLSRFARLARARVVPLRTRLTRNGYEIEVMPAWTDFPSADAIADTALMNQRLEQMIEALPAQYYWVHKRFKDRPPGMAPVY